jgi:hypothetical protein
MKSPRTGRVWPHADIRTAFENAVGEAGLGHFRFPDCRHHLASWFVMRRGSLQALKEILGRATINARAFRPGRGVAEVLEAAGAGGGS